MIQEPIGQELADLATACKNNYKSIYEDSKKTKRIRYNDYDEFYKNELKIKHLLKEILIYQTGKENKTTQRIYQIFNMIYTANQALLLEEKDLAAKSIADISEEIRKLYRYFYA